MHRKPRSESDGPLLKSCFTTLWAIGAVVCVVSTAYAFSIGPLPDLNCGGFLKPPCDLAPALDQYEEVHQLITFDALIQVRFTPPSGSASLRFSPQALRDIRDGNVQIDYIQGDHELHFDNAYLYEGGERLIKGKEDLLKQLRQQSNLSATQVTILRRAFGGYLHTLQDFYAHSNYVNLTSPPSIELGNARPPSQLPLTIPCFGDLLTQQGKTDLLTTGHAISPLQLGLAPFGQCAHGLLGNGIHKDWKGRDGHPAARTHAIAASTQFAISIINDPLITNKDNVCLFMADKVCQNSNSWNGTWIGAGTGGCDQPIPIVIAYRVSGASGESGSLSFTIIPPSDPAHNSVGSTFTLLYEGNIARPANPSILQTNTLNGDTMTEAYPPSCWTATLTRQ